VGSGGTRDTVFGAAERQENHLGRLTIVVIIDNMDVVNGRAGENTARLVDQSGAEGLPKDAQPSFLAALTVAAEGGKSDIAKPMHGLGSGVFEIALAFHGDAFRVIYVVQLADEIWVIHAFQKKSKQGIRTPKHEIDLVKDRLKRLKEALP
jgi:phage-related protein